MLGKEFINVPVPADRVEEVYAVLGQPRQSAAEATPAQEHPAENPPIEEALVIRAYEESPPGMVAVFDYLSEHPDRHVPMKELADGVGRRPDQVGGVLGAYGRRRKNRYGHAKSWPFSSSWDWDTNQGRYKMSAEVAAIIAKARES